MKTKNGIILAAGIAAILALFSACVKENKTSARTVEQIKKSGEIKIAVFSDKKPFGYVDEYGEYQGYDVYFGNRIAKDLGVKVKYVPIDAAASFVESLYNTAYEIDSYGVMPEEGEVLDDSYMVFQVRGDSMEPTIPDGAKILARKIEEGLWESASGVVSIVYGKTLSVKRILKNSLFLDNVLTLKADNPKHGQLDVERREIRGMWQALRIISQKII